MKRSYIYNLKLSQSVDSMWDLSPPPHTLLCQHATEKAMSNCRKKYVDMQITILKKSESVSKIKKKNYQRQYLTSYMQRSYHFIDIRLMWLHITIYSNLFVYI